MGVLGDIKGFVSGSGSVFMIIILAVADHLWGENVFNCPCGGERLLYTSAFLVVPPVLIIVIDVSWRTLCSTVAENCCGKAYKDVDGGKSDKGVKRDKDVEGRGESDKDGETSCCSCLCTCYPDTCCDRRTCETVVRLTGRPVIIAIVWLVFSCMEPKFGDCIFKTSSCRNEDEEKASSLRVIMAITMLSVTGAVVVFGGILFMVCGCCIPCTKQSGHSRVPNSSTSSNRKLTRVLYTLGLQPKTVITLRSEGLMDDRLLLHLTEDSLKALVSAISLGQLEILRLHKRDIRLVGWLLEKDYSESDIRSVLTRDQSFQTTGPVRDALNIGNIPTDMNIGALVDELRRNSIKPRTKQSPVEVPLAEEATQSI